jgi:hypothetical protein
MRSRKELAVRRMVVSLAYFRHLNVLEDSISVKGPQQVVEFSFGGPNLLGGVENGLRILSKGIIDIKSYLCYNPDIGGDGGTG